MLRSLSPADRQQLMEQLGISDNNQSQTPPEQVRQQNQDKTATRPDDSDEADKDLRLSAGDTVLLSVDFVKDRPARTQFVGEGIPPIVIPAEPAPEYPEEERLQLSKVIDLLRQRNPYSIDRDGVLQLPGLRPIALSGLTDIEATKRLQAEPAFFKLKVELVRLPLDRTGYAALKPFGYELFNQRVSTFAPGSDVPVPANYVVGPGDQLNVQLYGSQNRNLRLTVGRDGRLNFPDLGPIDVAGKSFDSVAGEIESRVSRQIIGSQASVSMGVPRSIQVFVMGEARKPGAYTVSGLATMTSALYASGGISMTGSLRDIQLKRRGATVQRLDLYERGVHSSGRRHCRRERRGPASGRLRAQG
ncbi:MAG: hypothetical protein EB048_11425 [Gammaproteobacteria bacterium]|nr:hypothetical protein [Gammaproteobacteria bacterium]